MAAISAAAVKSLRDKTGLPMMECKKALQDNNGDEASAIEWLRKQGAKTMAKRADRETAFGRMGIYTSFHPGVGAMVEVKCESAPVASSPDFIEFANGLAQQLATGPGAATSEELLAQPSPSKEGTTLGEQKDDLFNRLREVFNITRLARFEGPCGGYSHNAGIVSGVLLQVEGGNPEAAKDVSMHIAAMNPKVSNVEELDADEVAKEKEILMEAARTEGKPENIIEKMVEGRMRNYFAQHVLAEQPFVKDDKLTVSKFAKANGMKLLKFVHWELGKE